MQSSIENKTTILVLYVPNTARGATLIFRAVLGALVSSTYNSSAVTDEFRMFPSPHQAWGVASDTQSGTAEKLRPEKLRIAAPQTELSLAWVQATETPTYGPDVASYLVTSARGTA